MRRAIILSTAMMALLMITNVAAASVPRLMSFQGKLTDNSDQPLTGNYNFTFRIYGVATGGAALWTEAQNVVAVETGIYNVLLGSVTPLDLAFDTGYWLSVEVGVDGEMSPRYRLTSAPYALFGDSTTQVADGGNIAQRIVLTGTIDTSAPGEYQENRITDTWGAPCVIYHYKVVSDSRIALADLPNITVWVNKGERIAGTLDNVNQVVAYDRMKAITNWYAEEGKVFFRYKIEYLPAYYAYNDLYTPVPWSYDYQNGANYWVVIVK